MGNSLLKCVGCKERFPRDQMIKMPVGNFHSFGCLSSYGIEKGKKLRKAELNRRMKEAKAENKKRKEATKGRLYWYGKLGDLVNQYAKHVAYKDFPCYTCGKPQSNGGVFHAGHFMPAKRVDPRRFMLDNIRIQCYSCNSANSGRGAEYRRLMAEELGEDIVVWLETESNHRPLKDQYPDIEDIKAEILRYREMLRAEGITPRA